MKTNKRKKEVVLNIPAPRGRLVYTLSNLGLCDPFNLVEWMNKSLKTR